MTPAPDDPPADPAPSASRRQTGRATNVASVEACYLLVLWLIPVLDNLPRRQKFQLGDRLQTTALDVLDTLIEAAYTRERTALLQRANLGLEKLCTVCGFAAAGLSRGMGARAGPRARLGCPQGWRRARFLV